MNQNNRIIKRLENKRKGQWLRKETVVTLLPLVHKQLHDWIKRPVAG